MKTQSQRRVFIMSLVGAAGGAMLANSAVAQTAAPAAKVEKLDPKNPQAVALGYVEDTTKVDAKKYPKHTKEQKCANCQLYVEKEKGKNGSCAIFPGKLVVNDAWCSAYVKKAA